jgi:hypothetical protein
MKKTILLPIILILLVINVYAFEGGDGSKENPHLIATCEQLFSISAGTGSTPWRYFKLINDIDCEGSYYPSILNSHRIDLNGNFYTIKNINENGEIFDGIFSFDTYHPKIYNINFENIKINSTTQNKGVLFGRLREDSLVSHNLFAIFENMTFKNIIVDTRQGVAQGTQGAGILGGSSLIETAEILNAIFKNIVIYNSSVYVPGVTRDAGLVGRLVTGSSCCASNNVSFISSSVKSRGRLINAITGNFTIDEDNSFYNTDFSGTAGSSLGTAKNTSELTNLETYISTGWDINNIFSPNKFLFGIGKEINEGYPFLQKTYYQDGFEGEPININLFLEKKVITRFESNFFEWKFYINNSVFYNEIIFIEVNITKNGELIYTFNDIEGFKTLSFNEIGEYEISIYGEDLFNNTDFIQESFIVKQHFAIIIIQLIMVIFLIFFIIKSFQYKVITLKNSLPFILFIIISIFIILTAIPIIFS